MRLAGKSAFRLLICAFRRKARVCFSLILFFALSASAPITWASVLEETNFHHTAWGANGLGAVFDIQQASDGYLWLTTSTGVFRFDGVRFQSVEEATHGAALNSEIHAFFLSSSGGIWLVTRATGLSFWKDGKLTTYTDRRCTPVFQMGGIAEDRDGSLWLQAPSGLFHMQGTTCEQVDQTSGYPGGFPAALLVDSANTVWVRTLSGDVLYRTHGQSRFQRLDYTAGSLPSAFIFATATHNVFLHESPDRSIWLSDNRGLRQIASLQGRPLVSSLVTPAEKDGVQIGDFTFTAQGEIWAVSDKGLQRFDPTTPPEANPGASYATAKSFTSQQGLSSDAVWKVFIDRERNVWVGTNSGLDRLQRTALTSLVLPATQEHNFGVVADEQNSVWIGNRNLPLIRVAANGETTSFPETRGTICLRIDRQGTLWSAAATGATLWHFSKSGFSSMPYPEDDLGTIIAVAVDRNGDLFVNTATGGTYHLRGELWEKQNEALGKKPGILGTLSGDDEGHIWFGYSNRLARWDGTQWKIFSFPDGARGVSLTTMAIRGEHVWMGGLGGVSLFTKDQFRILTWKNHDFPGRVTGVLETTTGDLWMNGSSGITHVPASELSHWLEDPTYRVSAERLNALDGLPGLSSERLPEPSLTQSKDGRLWFATSRGVSWLDPSKLHDNRNTMIPPVIISSITSNGETYNASEKVRLPAHTERLEIQYTALSFTIPERVLFRYKLDGFDSTWQEAGTLRQAYYTRLPPGTYRFRVIACNNDGVWNEVGTSVEIFIAYAFYQTWWFYLVCVITVIALSWLLVVMRIRAVARSIRARAEERADERVRIARDLHDTLLQGIQGLMLRFHVAAQKVPAGDGTRDQLNNALSTADTILLEARDRVGSLRSTESAQPELSDAFEKIASDLNYEHKVKFSVKVEGTVSPLPAQVREELYFIGREALTNAFRHAAADEIVVSIIYKQSSVTLSIKDNGCGFDPKAAGVQGQAGHWGLLGMHERAHRLGAQLECRSYSGAGTEIVVRVRLTRWGSGRLHHVSRWWKRILQR
jgi:signal transduction histidine kinase/ligand-binding sensor domain-containing protein